MAKGALFTVFSDSAPAPAQSLTSAGLSNVNKPRRAGLSSSGPSNYHRTLPLSDENSTVSSWRGKENFDPFAKTVLSSKLIGKEKSTASVSCSANGQSASNPKPLATKARPFKLGPAPPCATNGVGSGTLQHASASAGICTGSVRLRSVPASTWGGRSPNKSTAAGLGKRPVELRPKTVAVTRAVVELALPSPSASESSVMSRASSKDSGYASGPRSLADEDYSGAEDEMSEDEAEVESSDHQAVTRLPKAVSACCGGSETVGDRRARALTESPLAEVSSPTIACAYPTLRSRPLRISLFPMLTRIRFNLAAHCCLCRLCQLLALAVPAVIGHDLRPVLQAAWSPFTHHLAHAQLSLCCSYASVCSDVAHQGGAPPSCGVDCEDDARLISPTESRNLEPNHDLYIPHRSRHVMRPHISVYSAAAVRPSSLS